jgi:hypothetical protein
MKVITACPLDCPDSCSLEVTVELGKIVDMDLQKSEASCNARVFERANHDAVDP